MHFSIPDKTRQVYERMSINVHFLNISENLHLNKICPPNYENNKTILP